MKANPSVFTVSQVRLRREGLVIKDDTTIHGYCTLIIGDIIEIENCAIGERYGRIRLCMPRLKTTGARLKLTHEAKVKLGKLAKAALSDAMSCAEAVA